MKAKPRHHDTRKTAEPCGNIISCCARSAFTLLELVMVMAILAVLTTIAVRSLDGVEDQTRFDATRQQLRDMENAILGAPDERDADGTPVMRGFVADVGRLPKAWGSDPATQLRELWSNPRNLAPPAVRSPASDPEVLMVTGWRGDYLRLGAGSSDLHDGWGRAWDLLKADQTTMVADGDPIAVIRSRGANGQIDGGTTSAFDADTVLTIATTVSVNDDRSQATISGRVYEYDSSSGQMRDPDSANGPITIRYFGPDPDTGLVQERSVVVSAPFTTVSYTFANIPVGPRVIRAYQGTPATKKSSPVRLLVRPGAQTKDLVLH